MRQRRPEAGVRQTASACEMCVHTLDWTPFTGHKISPLFSECPKFPRCRHKQTVPAKKGLTLCLGLQSTTNRPETTTTPLDKTTPRPDIHVLADRDNGLGDFLRLECSGRRWRRLLPPPQTQFTTHRRRLWAVYYKAAGIYLRTDCPEG